MTEKALEADFFEMSQRTPVTHGERSFFRNTKNVESVERPRKVFPSLEKQRFL